MSDEIQKLIKIMQEFQKINPEFPLQYALCLAEIYLNQGVSITELASKAQIPLSTVSRIISALSAKETRKTNYNLVSVTISDKEKRRKELNLTDEGLELMNSLKKIIKK